MTEPKKNYSAKSAGPKKLSREIYIDVALALIKENGVEKLSMRKVASKLNVSPMAVYRHFPDKQALLSASLDEFIVRAKVIPDDSLPWQEWITELAQKMYQALAAELSWIPVLGSLQLGEKAVTVTQAFLQKLTTEGFTEQQAFEAYLSMIQTMIGAVCLKSSMEKSFKGERKIEPLEISLPVLISGLQASR